MKYFVCKLKTLKVHIVLMCIFAALTYPPFCAAIMNCSAANAQYIQLRDAGYATGSPEIERANAIIADALSTKTFIGIIGAFALIAMFTTGLPILIKCFGYLSKKEYADMEMSAPVTANTRFFGSFFAGLTVYLVPHIIAVVTGMTMIAGDTGSEIYNNANEIVRRMMIYGLMMCLLFYCSTALIVAVCGRIKSVVVMTVLMNLAVPAVTVCSGWMSFNYGYGLTAGLWNEMTERIGLFTPLGLLLKFFVQGIFGTKTSGLIGIPQIMLFMLYCAVFVIAAHILIKHRRHERTGRAFVFRFARHTFTAISVLAATLIICVSVITSFDDMRWYGSSAETFAGIIIADIILWAVSAFGIFCACEFADSKGERYRKRRFGLFLPFLLGSALVTFLTTLTQGYGAAFFIPDPNEVESANVYLDIGDMGTTLYQFDPADVSAITELHKDIVSNNFDLSGGNDAVTTIDGSMIRFTGSSSTVDISYEMKDGSAYARYYTLPDAYLRKAFDTVKNNGTIFRENTFNAAEELEISTHDNITDEVKKTIKVPANELRDAFGADIRSLSYEQAAGTRYADGANIVIKYNISDNHSIWEYHRIFPFYTNTLDMLGKYGLSYYDIFGSQNK